MKAYRLTRLVFSRVVAVVVSILFVLSANAQTQALKQLELDIQKLAQLKAMLNNMYSGYSILSRGYDNIKSQSLASFNLHKNFIDGLSAISPSVKNAPAIASILFIQAQIVSEYKTTLTSVSASSVFTAKEIGDLTNAYSKILSRSTSNLDALQQVITPGKLQMTDPERLEILESLANDMEKQLGSLRTFTEQANHLSSLRLRLKKENNLLRNRYGIVK